PRLAPVAQINLIYEVETNCPRYFQRRFHRSHMEVYPNRTYTGLKAVFRGSFEKDYRAYKTAQRAEGSGEKSETGDEGLEEAVQQQSRRVAELETSVKDLTAKLDAFIRNA
uniref:PRELI/MSF1 domain-containing protein n=1 Tax=Macrostomum lignano TaxID=282301 RepID=A0A1I8HGV8_9PLAT